MPVEITSRLPPRESFAVVRDGTTALAERLSPEDCCVQSMPDASPAKWHLAHTTWFFEEFVLTPHAEGYRPFDPRFRYLFNSYYNAVGERHPRPQRGLITRPSLEEVWAYREHVDAAMLELLTKPELAARVASLVELGMNHEEQHQELLLYDVKHLFSCNPLGPVYEPRPATAEPEAVPLGWQRFDEGLYEIGHTGDSFAFDNESPRHPVYLGSFEIARRLVTNAEYLEFIVTGGYEQPEHWLSAGWDCVRREGWTAPLYWRRGDSGWETFTLAGWLPLSPHEPVMHVSFFEADAFARYRRCRLPTEAEWEVAALTADRAGNLLESGFYHPLPATPAAATSLSQCYGDLWEWTGSAYRPYPRYAPPAGALGEYNGKFMSGQMVLRGGSCATPSVHIRPTYRNFFPPESRWQFGGVRLARDV